MATTSSQFKIQDSRFKIRGEAAFTLLELSLVLLILSIALVFIVPRLRDPSSQDLVSHVRRLATTFRFLRSEAVMNGRVYLLNYDLDQQRYWISSENTPDTTGVEAEDELGLFAKPVALPPSVAFSDIVFQGVGALNQGQMFTKFYPDGYVDATVVHMDNGRQAFTLEILPLTGQVNMYDGYQPSQLAQ